MAGELRWICEGLINDAEALRKLNQLFDFLGIGGTVNLECQPDLLKGLYPKKENIFR